MRWLNRQSDHSVKRRGAELARRRATQHWTRRGLRVGAVVAAVAVLGGGPWWAVRTGWMQPAYRATTDGLIAFSAMSGFTVEEVLLEGRNNAAREAVIAVVDLKRGQPIYGFDIDAVRRRIEALPWVRTAVVMRELPSTVRITLVERRPLALWQRDGRLALVDEEGAVIAEPVPERYRTLLMVVGDDAPRHAKELITLLAREAALAKRISAAVWVGERRWNLRFENGIDVNLPEANAEAAWIRFAQIERQFGLLARDVASIDLRLPDRLIVRTKTDKRDSRLSGGKST